jgi:predicted transcriptional regulator YdeE
VIPKSFAALLFLLVGGASAMHPKTVEVKGFSVIGIRVRTNNGREATPNGLIGGQWQKFMQENLLTKIPGRLDSNVLVLYTNYAADKNGDYDYIIGAKVNSTAEAPGGMVKEQVPSGKYAVFTSDRGPIQQVTVGLWRKIWAYEESGKGKRAYKTDYEVHDARSADRQNSQIDVYVGVK